MCQKYSLHGGARIYSEATPAFELLEAGYEVVIGDNFFQTQCRRLLTE